MENTARKFIRSKKILVENVEPGMTLAEDIKTAAGGVILPADSILSMTNIERLKEFDIFSIYVEEETVLRESDAMRGKRAVVIDDALFFRHMFSKMLYKMGIFVMEEVETAEEGVCHARKYRPDLVIVDIHLPGMTGIEAIRDIKSKCSVSKCVAVSTDKDRKTVVDALRAGADDFLVKPVMWDRLKPRICKLFDSGKDAVVM